MSLYPTLWRTCRALANKRRLICLQKVLEQPGWSVCELAEKAKIPSDQTSLCLRALQARGLLHASRDGKWVRYYPWTDPLVPDAEPILKGMRRALLDEKQKVQTVIHCLTAFTHPRRLTLLRLLAQKGPLTFTGLYRITHISQPALVRHLAKLEGRAVIERWEESWRLTPSRSSLTDALLILVAGERVK